MSKNRGIQYEVVAAIADRLVDQGFRPEQISAGAIREETHTGSLSTIMTHLNHWRLQNRPATPTIDLTQDMGPITAAVTALVAVVSERVREEARDANAAAAIEADRIRARLDEALAINEQIEAEREAIAAESDVLRNALVDARLREARLEGKLEALQCAPMTEPTPMNLDDGVAVDVPETENSTAPVDRTAASHVEGLVRALTAARQQTSGDLATEAAGELS